MKTALIVLGMLVLGGVALVAFIPKKGAPPPALPPPKASIAPDPRAAFASALDAQTAQADKQTKFVVNLIKKIF